MCVWGCRTDICHFKALLVDPSEHPCSFHRVYVCHWRSQGTSVVEGVKGEFVTHLLPPAAVWCVFGDASWLCTTATTPDWDFRG